MKIIGLISEAEAASLPKTTIKWTAEVTNLLGRPQGYPKAFIKVEDEGQEKVACYKLWQVPGDGPGFGSPGIAWCVA